MLNKFFIFLFLAIVNTAYAQSIVDSEQEVALHKKQKTSFEYKTKEKSIFEDTADALVPVPGYHFSMELPSEAGQFDGLPSCINNQIRELPRAESEDSFMSLDIFVYQYGNSEQQKRADAYGYKAVPYIEGALSNPYRPQGDQAQTIIRALGIECLPTRVRSVTRDGQKYFEYREGNKSWKSEE